MRPQRRRRLILVLCLMAGLGVATGLVLYALKKNINLYFTPTQIEAGASPPGAHIRAGGLVVKGSVHHVPNSLTVNFDITDFKTTVPVTYTGILPDLFRAGQGIVALGQMGPKGVFHANQVLAKHDEKYTPPAVSDELKKAGVTVSQYNAPGTKLKAPPVKSEPPSSN